MVEGEGVSVQELPLESEVSRGAVDRVARDRQPDRVEMHPDLVRAAGLEPYLEQGALAEPLAHLEPGDGLARCIRVDRPARPIGAVAADRGVDPPRPRPGCPSHEGEVASLDLPLSDRRRELFIGALRARDEQQARRVPVEPVDDPRPPGITTGGAEADEPVDQRLLVVSWRRVDDEPGRLVDHEQVLVLEDDLEWLVGRLEPGRAGKRDLELFPALEPMALRAALAVDQDRAVADQALRQGPRGDSWQGGDDDVETPAGVRLRNARAVSGQRTRSCGPPPRTRGRAARRRPR